MAKTAATKTTGGKGAKKTAKPKAASKKAAKKVVKKTARRRSAALKPPAPQAKPAPRPRRLRKSPLARTELKEFRQMLLEKRRALVGDMNGMEAEALRTNRQEGTGDLSKIPTHDADVGTDNFEQEFTLGLLESERILLGEIDEALDRINRGVYGICEGTGQAIAKPRLRAKPWARYCIEYAKMVEKGLAPRTQEAQADDEDADEDDD